MFQTISNNDNLCRVRGHGVRSSTGGSFRQKIVLILLITAAVLGSTAGLSPASNKTGINVILLKNRQFVPEVAGKLSISKITGHAIIQFEEEPNDTIIDILASHQVNVLEWIPRNAVMAYIPEAAQVESIPGIRWVGKLNPTDKISAHLNQSLTKGFVLIDVYPDVMDQRAQAVISKAQGEIIENDYLGQKTYLVRATEEIATELSMADEISWIWPASDAIINGEPVYYCPGPKTASGLIVPNYCVHDDGWDGPGLGSASLKYYFGTGTPDTSGEWDEVEDALYEWAKYAQITWTRTYSANQNRSVDIKWGTGSHGGCPDPFEGELGHSFYPSPPNPEPIAGDIHINDEFDWRDYCSSYYWDVYTVVLHEAGHSLGLCHSSNTAAVMYPYVSISGCFTGLHQDDIDGIRSIYASRVPPLPDLYDDGESWRSFSPTTIQGGQNLSISCDVRNGGTAASGSFVVKFYASSNTTISSSDYYIEQKSMSSISAGGWANCDWSGPFPASIPAGVYWVGWIIDADNNVSESNENNNTAYKQGYQLTVVQPTLTVTSPEGGWWELGETLPIAWDSENTSGNVKIELYKGGSFDRIIDPNTDDDGVYDWSIPTDGNLIGANNYQVKVTDVSNSSCFDYSSNFGIATPPEANDVTVTTSVDTPVTITLQAADEGQPDPPAALTYIITSLPIHGDLNEPGVGLIIDPCTPLVGYGNQVEYIPDIGYVGQDSFTFEANDGGVPPGGGDSNEATITIDVSACTTIPIGTGTFTWNYPMHTYYHDSRTQVIYLASEIGMPGIITDLALDVTTVPGQTMNNWTIRMKHTSLGYYSTASLDATGWTTVYDENESIGSTGWRTFILSTPFVYNGTDNLLVDFSHDNSSYTTNGYCMVSSPGGTRSAYACSDSGWGDPLTWSGTTSPSVYGSSYVPNIQLTICEECSLGAPVLHAEPNITPGLRNTIWWDPVPDVNWYYAECANDANFANTVIGSGWISETNCTFTGLDLGQTYWYRVKATPQIKSWSQTSQAEFQTDTLIDTIATSGGDVVLTGGGSTIFQDDFEDGNYDGWINGTSSCIRQVTDETAAAGTTYSFTQIGSSDHREGVYYTLPSITPDRLTFHVRTDSTDASGYVLLDGANSSECAVFFYSGYGQLRVSQDTSYGTERELLTWYKVEFVFHWLTKTFDFYVDDELVADSIPFRNSATSYINTIHLYNFRNAQAWWDEIEFSSSSGGSYAVTGDIVSTLINLPAGGSWDIVDFNTTTPANTELTVDVLNGLDESVILADVNSVTDISWITATELKLRANLSTDDPNNTPVLHDWSVSYVACESDWSNVESSLQCDTLCDFDNNNEINFIDFAILAGQWLQVPGSPSTDIAPEVPDGFVDFLDLAVFVENWLLDLTCTVQN